MNTMGKNLPGEAILFRQLFDPESSTYTYLIADRESKDALLVDPVLEQVERDLKLLHELGLTLRFCVETHIHADHITGTDKLRARTGCQGIVPENAHAACADRYLRDGEILSLGSISVQTISTPGHTDSHNAYLVIDDSRFAERDERRNPSSGIRQNGNHRVLTGDALLIRGCGRTDFQSGDAGTLYDSVTQKLFTLPEETLVYPGHDYRGHTLSTIGEEKQWNPRFHGRSREAFIDFMSKLDLPNPKKMMAAVPANEQCGSTTK